MKLDDLWEDRRIKILAVFVVFSVIMIMFNGISKGIDLEGGSRVNLRTEHPLTQKEMAELLTIMETRLNFLGIKDVRVNSLGIDIVQIEIAGVTPDEAIDILGTPGRLTVKVGNSTVFTGKDLIRVDSFGREPGSGWGVPFTITGEAAITFRDTSVENGFPMVYMYLDEGSVMVLSYTDELDGIEEQLSAMGLEGEINVTKDKRNVLTTITFDEPVDELGFERISESLDTINSSYDGRIRGMIFDSTGLVNNAPISQGLQALLRAGETAPSMIITTGGDEEGRLQAKQIEAVLRSGTLTVKVEIIEKLIVPPELGEEFVKNAILAGLFGIIAVALVIFIRYRDSRIVLPIIGTGISEVIIILGIASLIRWNIDLPAIAGIIAAVGTGVDDQIVITDEVFLEMEKSLRYRMKNAFFIIMAAWMTTVAAMFPLFSIGLQIMRGFALTTIIGVTIGVAVTRPAYASIIKNIIGGD